MLENSNMVLRYSAKLVSHQNSLRWYLKSFGFLWFQQTARAILNGESRLYPITKMIFKTFLRGFEYLNSVMIVLLKERKKDSREANALRLHLHPFLLTLDMLTKENKPPKPKCLFG